MSLRSSQEERESQKGSIFWNILRDNYGITGMVLVLFFVVISLLALAHLLPSLPQYNFSRSFAPPSTTDFPWYIFGTTYFGQPVLLQLFYGTPYILEVTLLSGLIIVAVGTAVGLIMGYLGGFVDLALSTIVDTLLALPSLLIFFILAPILKTSNVFVIAGLLSVFAWTPLSRSIRSITYQIRENDFITIARTLGYGRLHVISKEIAPILFPYIFISFTQAVVGAVYGLVGIYFFGLLPLNLNNWGVMLYYSVWGADAFSVPSGVFSFVGPIIVIVLYTFGFIALGTAMDKVANPTL